MQTNTVNAQSHSTPTFTVKVTNIDKDRGGNIMVMLFSQDGFPKVHSKALSIQTHKAESSELLFSFEQTLEEIAVKVLHDENEDTKVTKNWTGIWPKDGLGFTNQQKVTLTGPPNYKNSKVSKAQYQKGLFIAVVYP
ncbi:hypothetical protein CW748_09895 [Alteromonadales bacterium alter-6D02]|nr:hypothetical protein CW748_09895 [Alteromonadales bacterium alter-6D02]